MLLNVLGTLPLDCGRVLCSFRVREDLRALVKLYDNPAEFNFLVEYLKLIQSVTANGIGSEDRYESMICVPLHALKWPITENKGDGREQFCEVFSQLTMDVIQQIKLQPGGNGPRLFIPFTLQSRSLACAKIQLPPNGQGLVIAYTAPHHLSTCTLSSDACKTIYRAISKPARASSAPAMFRVKKKCIELRAEGFFSELESRPDSSASGWIMHNGIKERRVTESLCTPSSFTVESEYLHSVIGQSTYHHRQYSSTAKILTLFEDQDILTADNFSLYCDGLKAVCKIGIDASETICIEFSELQIFETLSTLFLPYNGGFDFHISMEDVFDHELGRGKMDAMQCESHNSINAGTAPTGHRSSLSIISHKMCLRDLFKLAERITLPNGIVGDEIPLPTASMKFIIKPINYPTLSSAGSTPGESNNMSEIHADWQLSDNQNAADSSPGEGLKLQTTMPDTEDRNTVELTADLDVGFFLHKWLSKLSEEDSPYGLRESVRRSLRQGMGEQRTSDGGRRKSDLSPEIHTTSQRESPKVSRNFGSGHLLNEQITGAETLVGNRTRPLSECLRPWIPQPADIEMSPGADETMPNVLQRISDGTHEMWIQSVDLLSSGSTLSVPLSNNTNVNGGENASNTCAVTPGNRECVPCNKNLRLNGFFDFNDHSIQGIENILKTRESSPPLRSFFIEVWSPPGAAYWSMTLDRSMEPEPISGEEQQLENPDCPETEEFPIQYVGVNLSDKSIRSGSVYSLDVNESVANVVETKTTSQLTLVRLSSQEEVISEALLHSVPYDDGPQTTPDALDTHIDAHKLYPGLEATEGIVVQNCAAMMERTIMSKISSKYENEFTGFTRIKAVDHFGQSEYGTRGNNEVKNVLTFPRTTRRSPTIGSRDRQNSKRSWFYSKPYKKYTKKKRGSENNLRKTSGFGALLSRLFGVTDLCISRNKKSENSLINSVDELMNCLDQEPKVKDRNDITLNIYERSERAQAALDEIITVTGNGSDILANSMHTSEDVCDPNFRKDILEPRRLQEVFESSSSETEKALTEEGIVNNNDLKTQPIKKLQNAVRKFEVNCLNETNPRMIVNINNSDGSKKSTPLRCSPSSEHAPKVSMRLKKRLKTRKQRMTVCKKRFRPASTASSKYGSFISSFLSSVTDDSSSSIEEANFISREIYKLTNTADVINVLNREIDGLSPAASHFPKSISSASPRPDCSVDIISKTVSIPILHAPPVSDSECFIRNACAACSFLPEPQINTSASRGQPRLLSTRGSLGVSPQLLYHPHGRPDDDNKVFGVKAGHQRFSETSRTTLSLSDRQFSSASEDRS